MNNSGIKTAYPLFPLPALCLLLVCIGLTSCGSDTAPEKRNNDLIIQSEYVDESLCMKEEPEALAKYEVKKNKDDNRVACERSLSSVGYGSSSNTAATGGRPVQSMYEAECDRANTEAYDLISENGFLDPVNHPLSTFSIDVDTASYSNVRRYLQSGSLPPRDAVRIEELINYFSYDYPEPEGDAPFSITTEAAACPWNPKHALVHIGLQGKKVDTKDLPPSNLVFLLDVSGSMNSPDKLPLLKSAFRLLVNQLTERDRVAIVVYAGAAGLVLPSTPGSNRDALLQAIDRLQAGGSTAGGAGIHLAYHVAAQNFIPSGNNRVILATDGDFNVGASSDAEMTRLIEDRRNEGVFLTVLGFGTGNIKDSKMEKLADRGNGNYAYIDNIMEAKKVLVNEMGATLLTIAKDVKLQIEFNPAHVMAYRLIGYENRMLRSEDFNDDTKDAGELGAGHTVTALYEIIPSDADEKLPDIDALKYQRAETTAQAHDSQEMLTVKFRYKAPDGNKSLLLVQTLPNEWNGLESASPNFLFSAAVAEYGMLLRGSEHKAKASWEQVIELAGKARGPDGFGYRAEFIRLAESSRLMSEGRGEG